MSVSLLRLHGSSSMSERRVWPGQQKRVRERGRRRGLQGKGTVAGSRAAACAGPDSDNVDGAVHHDDDEVDGMLLVIKWPQNHNAGVGPADHFPVPQTRT